MDARYFQERAKTCLRLAEGLSWNNPGRYQLMDMAENLQKRASELEAQERSAAPPPQPQSEKKE